MKVDLNPNATWLGTEPNIVESDRVRITSSTGAVYNLHESDGMLSVVVEHQIVVKPRAANCLLVSQELF